MLADCTERRLIRAADYNETISATTATAGGGHRPVTKQVTRQLRQAMVPGAHLVKVEMDQTAYSEKVVNDSSTVVE